MNQATKINIPRTLVSLDDDTQKIKMNIDDLSSLKKAIITGVGGSGKTTYIEDVFRFLGEKPLYVDYELFSRVIMPRYGFTNDSTGATTREELSIISVKALFLYEMLANDLDNLIRREDLFEILDERNELFKNMQLRWEEGVSIVIDNVKFNNEGEDVNFITWYTTLGLKDSDKVFILTDPKTGSHLSHLLPVYTLEHLNFEEVDTLIKSSGPSGNKILAFMELIAPALTADPRNMLDTPEDVEVFVKVCEEEIKDSNVDHFDRWRFAEKMYYGILWTRYTKMAKAFKAIGVEVCDYKPIFDCEENFNGINDLAKLRTGNSEELFDIYAKFRIVKSLTEVQRFSSYLKMRILLTKDF